MKELGVQSGLFITPFSGEIATIKNFSRSLAEWVFVELPRQNIILDEVVFIHINSCRSHGIAALCKKLKCLWHVTMLGAVIADSGGTRKNIQLKHHWSSRPNL